MSALWRRGVSALIDRAYRRAWTRHQALGAGCPFLAPRRRADMSAV